MSLISRDLNSSHAGKEDMRDREKQRERERPHVSLHIKKLEVK